MRATQYRSSRPAGHIVTVVTGVTEPAAGHVYLAPGDAHLVLNSRGLLDLSKGEARHFQIPSVDELFDSIAEHNVAQTFAALLTGMGSDGASGLARLGQVGARTAVQSLASCVVPGMPSAALEINDQALQLSPEELATAAVRFFASNATLKDATPDPHWQIVDAGGRTYLLQRLGVKSLGGLATDRINMSIVLPDDIRNVAKVQIYCSWAEAVLGEAAFPNPQITLSR
jgi:hypothetical protein